MDDVTRALSEKLVAFLETGTVPEGLFRPDVFLDLTMPTWRVQAAGTEDLIAERKQGHPGPGRVTAGGPTQPRPGSSSNSRSDGTMRARSGTRGR